MSDHSLEDIAAMAAKGHSAFSPSSSKMWLTCLGSLIPNLLAEDDMSEEAAEGTVAHSVAEEWLKTGERPDHLLGQIEIMTCPKTKEDYEIEITDEMLTYVGDYVAVVEELRPDAVEFLTETRVDFSNLTPIPDQGGTADNIAIVRREDADDEFEIIVTDLKYGKGVRVIAEGNTQGKLYAYGSFRLFRNKYKITRIRIVICHPRLEGGTTETVFTVDELLDFARYVKERAHGAWRFDAPRTPSDEGCMWCRVKATCPALYEHISEVTSDAFDDDDEFVHPHSLPAQIETNRRLEDELGDEPFRFVNPVELSTVALAKVLRYRGLTEKFFSAVEAELLNRAHEEEEIPGWKLVRGRTRRTWPSNEAAAYLGLKKAGLKDGSIYIPQMISPAEAEKRLRSKAGLTKDEATKVVADLAIKPLGKESLVRVSDPREALASDADSFLDDDPFERIESERR